MFTTISRPSRIRRHARPGAALVEFAVVSPVLVLLVMGMIEVSRAIQVKNYLTDASRSAGRVAIQPGNSTSDVTANVNSILTANGLPTAYATTTVLVNGASVDVNTAKKYDLISVQVSIPVSRVNWVPLIYFNSTSVESEKISMMHY